MVYSGAAVFFADGWAKKALFAHFFHDGDVELLCAICFKNARHEAIITECACRIHDHAFFFAQLLAKEKGIIPCENRCCAHLPILLGCLYIAKGSALKRQASIEAIVDLSAGCWEATIFQSLMTFVYRRNRIVSLGIIR